MKEPKYIRVRLKHGSARVKENVSQKTIDMLNELATKAYNMSKKDWEILTNKEEKK